LVRPQQAARRAAAAAKKAIEVQASKEAARKEAEETAAVAAAEREAAAKEKMEEKAAKAAARALKAEQKAAAQAEKAAHRAAQKVALDRSARDFGHLERAAKRKSDNGGVAGSRPLSPNDDSNFGNEKKHRPLIRSPGLAETSNDPEHTPHADDFLDSVAALLKKEGQAAAQLVLHNHMSGIDATNALSIDALSRLEKAKSTTTERIAELKEVNIEYTQLQAANYSVHKPEANSKVAAAVAIAAAAYSSKGPAKQAPSVAEVQSRLSSSVYGLLGVDGDNDVDAEDFNSYFDELSGYVDGLVGQQSRA